MPRLDIEIVNRGLAKSRALAQSYIAEGKVMLNGNVIDKASKYIKDSDEIIVTDTLQYVSRGGLKLERAIFEWLPSLGEGLGMGKDFICLDIGSSTGGFTDCLLQHGATHVTAVDVGSNQLDVTLRDDERIMLFENTDIRSFNPHQYFDLITIDTSFISLTKIIPHLAQFCFDKGDVRTTKVIALVKPQFEVGKGNLNNKGIVKTFDANGRDISSQVYSEVIENIKKSFEDHGFGYISHIDSPIAGGDGNREFLMCVGY